MHPPGPASRTGKCSVAIRSKVAGAVAAAQQQRSGKRQRGGRNRTPGYSRNRTPECRGQKPPFGKWGGVPPESTRIPLFRNRGGGYRKSTTFPRSGTGPIIYHFPIWGK